MDLWRNRGQHNQRQAERAVMRIKLTCCCGATIEIEEDFVPYAQKTAIEWQERHVICCIVPMAPWTPGGAPCDPSPPWIGTCGGQL